MKHNYLFAIIPAFLFMQCNNSVTKSSSDNFVDRVNVFIGTTNGGNTVPAAQAPFGMISFGPSNWFNPINSDPYISRPGYDYSKDSILNFSLTHVSGWGCHGALDLPFMPFVGELQENPVLNPSAYASLFSHENEHASPGFYEVLLSSINTHVKGAVSERSAIIEINYPLNGNAHLLFTPTNCSNGITDAEILIDQEKNMITGHATSGGFCSRDPKLYDYTVYFAVALNHAISEAGGWNGASKTINNRNYFSGDSIAAYISIDSSDHPLLEMQLAISFVSVENAMLNLEQELDGKDIKALKQETTEKWNAGLSKMKVETNDNDLKVQLYTALYHNMLQPSIFDDVNGQYRGFNDLVYCIESGKHKYVNFSTWDTYRTSAQLQGLLFPNEASDMIYSLYLDTQQGAPNGLPIWGYFNNETGVMNGHGSVPLIANMYAFGARDIDLDTIAATLVWNGDNKYRSGADYIKHAYVPDYDSPWNYSVSKTIEYSTADFAIAQMCKYAGDTANYKRFLTRSNNVFNLFNEDIGYLQRKSRTGDWIKPFDKALVTGFNEGNSAQYTWNIPHNFPLLIEKMGGAQKAIQKLDLFTSEILFDGWNVNKPFYWPSNQPSFIAPYVYNYAGAPEKARQLIGSTITNIFGNHPGGLPGNDDLGATSAMFLFQVAGFYPILPGVPEITFTGSLVDKIQFNLDNGASLTFIANKKTEELGKITEIKVNEKSYDSYWVKLEELIEAGKNISIEFTIE